MLHTNSDADICHVVLQLKKYRSLSLAEKVSALEELERLKSQQSVADLFGVSQSQISRIARNRQAILLEWEKLNFSPHASSELMIASFGSTSVGSLGGASGILMEMCKKSDSSDFAGSLTNSANNANNENKDENCSPLKLLSARCQENIE